MAGAIITAIVFALAGLAIWRVLRRKDGYCALCSCNSCPGHCGKCSGKCGMNG